MKKLFVAKNSVEAHMIVQALEENDIKAVIRGEHDPFLQPTVWLEDSEDIDKAKKIIKEIEDYNKELVAPAQSIQKENKKFWLGVLVGVLLTCLILFLSFRSYIPFLNKPAAEGDTNNDGITDVWLESKPDGIEISISDSNFDGDQDSWFYYKNNRIEKVIIDFNHDQKADTWFFYNKDGFMILAERDTNFDENVDLWEYYTNGYLVKAACDSDFDGKKDCWDKYENSMLIERTYSYNNDTVIDTKAIYKNNILVEKLFDINRDGKFDQRVLLDKFERIIKRENL